MKEMLVTLLKGSAVGMSLCIILMVVSKFVLIPMMMWTLKDLTTLP